MALVRDRFWRSLVALGMLSGITGVVELSVPEFVLKVFSMEESPTSRFLLANVGVMTVAFNVMLLFALTSAIPQHVPFLWCGVQKCATAALTGIGVQQKILSSAGVTVAMFDLICGVMIVGYWYWVRQVARERELDELTSS